MAYCLLCWMRHESEYRMEHCRYHERTNGAAKPRIATLAIGSYCPRNQALSLGRQSGQGIITLIIREHTTKGLPNQWQPFIICLRHSLLF